jgi:flagellar hook-length control protein FliK
MISMTSNSAGQVQQPARSPVAAGAGADSAPDAAQDTSAALPLAALPFANLLGQLAEAGNVDTSDAAPAADAGAEPVAAADDAESQAGEQPPLTGAMAMALPLMPAALAAANIIANTNANPTVAAVGAADATPVRDGRTAARPGAVPARADQDDAVAPQPVTAQAARPAAPVAADADGAKIAPAGAAHGTTAGLAAAANGSADSATGANAPTLRDSAGVTGVAPAAQVPAAPRDGGAGTVALSGPPTAWRQSLREALGERVQVQTAHGLDQAVIRLDPPQLGRVEIAIRHSAGSLEVTLSATHGEVLRQLQGVSESLRSDLAQRQYADVSVTVAPAPRNAAANPFGAEAGNRGRQGGREQEQQAPGLALFDDAPAATGFSLT